MASADISIRGAGIFGLSIAWVCVQRGARVDLVDPGGPGAGASGGVVGALAPHVPENWNPKKQFQLESLLMAAPFWAGVEAAGGHSSGYVRAGRVQPVPASGLDLARARGEGADRLWKGAARWAVVDGAPGWGLRGPVIHDTLSAHLHPRQACMALAAALAAQGVTIRGETAAPDAPVIWATGAAGLARISDHLGARAGQPIKGQAAVLQADFSDQPQLFVDGLHIIPHLNGTVAIGSTTEREFDDPLGTDAQLDAVIARAKAAVPALARAPVIARWAGLRPRARSRAPMLGPWPGRAGHYIANGGFKIGFGMAPKIAHVMADLVLEGRDDVPEGFDVAASL